MLLPLSALTNAQKVKPTGKRITLALGESSGHSHCMDAADVTEFTMTDANNVVERALKVIRETSLKHIEHDGRPTGDHHDIAVPPGNYLVIIQREALADDEVRLVQD
jgi:hypothetical protein